MAEIGFDRYLSWSSTLRVLLLAGNLRKNRCSYGADN